RSHIAQITFQKLNHLCCEILFYSLYSPDLSSADCHLFKRLSNFLREETLQNQSAAENAFEEFRTPSFTRNWNKQTSCFD
ncbi:Histone-lysine N-methyltransferase SETMAR, partial [Habropoda laboriosa]